MCGRYELEATVDDLEREFNARVSDSLKITPRYNVAPSQVMPIVTKDKTLILAHWGYAPSWAEERSPVINARIEGLSEKAYYRGADRCLVPANGFYEWQRAEDGKIPYFIHLPDRSLFAFAGVCNEGGYAIVTTEANEEVREIHSRMPVIVAPSSYDVWLGGETPPDTPTRLEFHEISTAVNSPRNDTPDLIQPMPK